MLPSTHKCIEKIVKQRVICGGQKCKIPSAMVSQANFFCSTRQKKFCCHLFWTFRVEKTGGKRKKSKKFKFPPLHPIGASRGVCISQIFNSIHNFSPPFFSSLVKLLNAGICISGIRPASGGVNLPKWTSSRHFRTVHSTQYTGTPHHVLSCESQHTPQWVGHHPTQKKPPQKKKSIHNFSHFSQFFTIFHQPSQFYSGFRVVKTCENLSHFVKICEMHTPREAPPITHELRRARDTPIFLLIYF